MKWTVREIMPCGRLRVLSLDGTTEVLIALPSVEDPRTLVSVGQEISFELPAAQKLRRTPE